MNNTIVIIGQSEYLSTLPVHLVTSLCLVLVVGVETVEVATLLTQKFREDLTTSL